MQLGFVEQSAAVPNERLLVLLLAAVLEGVPVVLGDVANGSLTGVSNSS